MHEQLVDSWESLGWQWIFPLKRPYHNQNNLAFFSHILHLRVESSSGPGGPDGACSLAFL